MLEGRLESILSFFLQITGDETGPEWDDTCPKSHRKSMTKLKFAPKSLNSKSLFSHFTNCIFLWYLFQHHSATPWETLGLGFLWFPTDSVRWWTERFFCFVSCVLHLPGIRYRKPSFLCYFLGRNKVSVNNMSSNESRQNFKNKRAEALSFQNL